MNMVLVIGCFLSYVSVILYGVDLYSVHDSLCKVSTVHCSVTSLSKENHYSI